MAIFTTFIKLYSCFKKFRKTHGKNRSNLKYFFLDSIVIFDVCFYRMGLVQSASRYMFGKSLNYQRKRKRHSCRLPLNESDEEDSDSSSNTGHTSKR